MKKLKVSFFFPRMHFLSLQMEENYKFTVCGLIGSKNAVSLFISYCKKDLVWGEEKQPEAAKPG